LGYAVLAAGSGGAALELLQRHPEVDLLLIDVVMPEISGPEVVQKAISIAPGTQILFMSGYIAEAAAPFDYQVLSKPFTVAELAAKVDQALKRISYLPANVTRLRQPN
jgi:CheY-like chemotaxis protein